ALLASRGVTVEHWRGLDAARFPAVDAPGPMLPEDEVPVEEHDLRDFLHVFEAQHAALLALAGGISLEEMERKPDENTWSPRPAVGAHAPVAAALPRAARGLAEGPVQHGAGDAPDGRAALHGHGARRHDRHAHDPGDPVERASRDAPHPRARVGALRAPEGDR